MEKGVLENNIEKPSVLYHGSINPDLEELEPRALSWRDKDEGPRIFATPDRRLATIFAGKNEMVVGSGTFNNTPYARILGTADEFIASDKGGYLYTLPTDSFECDPGKGLGTSEWTCKVNVKPHTKEHFDSALDAMLAEGVQVFFMDNSTHEAIQNSKDHGYSILKSMQSENQKRGVNVVDF